MNRSATCPDDKSAALLPVEVAVSGDAVKLI